MTYWRISRPLLTQVKQVSNSRHILYNRKAIQTDNIKLLNTFFNLLQACEVCMNKCSLKIILLRIVCKAENLSILYLLTQNSRFLLVEAETGGFFSCSECSSEVVFNFEMRSCLKEYLGDHTRTHWQDFLFKNFFT
jgi:hypothetical protein